VSLRRPARLRTTLLAATLASSILVPLTATPALAAGTLMGTVQGDPVVGNFSFPDDSIAGPRAGIRVNVWSTAGAAPSIVAFATTDETGAYSIPDLSPGAVHVQFVDTRSASGNYGRVFFGSPTFPAQTGSSATNLDSAPVVDIQDGATPTTVNAQLEDGGSVSGRIQEDGTGAILTDICVQLYDAGNGAFVAGSVNDDPEGDYTVGSVPAGTYRILFRDDLVDAYDCSSSRGASGDATQVSEYYDNIATFQNATGVTVGTGGVSGINASLANAGGAATLSGSVTQVGGGGLGGICIDVFPSDAGDFTIDNNPTTTTAASGAWSANVGAGSYKISFSDCLGSNPGVTTQWYSAKSSAADASIVTVTNDQTRAGLNAVLAVAGSISGSVTEAATGNAALADICVIAYDSANAEIARAQTNADGDYTIPGLAPMTYRVKFSDALSGDGPSGSSGTCPTPETGSATHLDEWYNDKDSFATATGVSVASGQAVTGITAALLRAADGHTISGTVSGSGGSGVNQVCVRLYDGAGAFLKGTRTSTLGAYSLGPVINGSYRVRVSDLAEDCVLQTGQPNRYATRWYDNDDLFANASPIVVNGANVTDRNVSLVDGVTNIGGTVTSTAGSKPPIASVCVRVFNATQQLYGEAVTNGDGEWRLAGLPGGSYRAQFVPDLADGDDCVESNAEGGGTAATDHEDAEGEPEYSGEWYLNKGSFSTSTPFTPTAGSTMTNIDGTLSPPAAAGPLGTMSGVIAEPDQEIGDEPNTDPIDSCCPSDDPISNVCVQVVRLDWDGTAEDIVSQTKSNPGAFDDPDSVLGEYSLQAPSGVLYRVRFTDDPALCAGGAGHHVTEWFDERSTFESGNSLQIPAGGTTNRSETLQTAGLIAGRVTEADTTNGISDVEVQVADAESGSVIKTGTTDANGRYTVGSIRPGVYRVFFKPSATNLRGTWYSQVETFGAADDVEVTAKTTTGGINGQLQRNDPPVAGDDTATAAIDTPVTINYLLANDADPNGDEIHITSVGPATPHGTVVLNADGTVTYTPGGGRDEDVTFPYTIEDVSGLSDSATVSVTMVDELPDGEPPVARDDSARTFMDRGVTVDVLANDTDPDGDDAALEVTAVSQPLSGSVVITSNGRALRYTPSSGFMGTATFSYTITDADTLTATAKVTVIVGDSSGESGAGQSTTPAGGTVSTGGTEATPDNPIITSVTTPNAGSVEITENTQAERRSGTRTIAGVRVDITAPAASASNPLVIRFRIDGSVLDGQHPHRTYLVLRNLSALAECAGSTVANPDPCVSARRLVGDDTLLTIRTSSASTWEFALEDDPRLLRLSGSGRVQTAVEISRWTYVPAEVDTVVIARSDAYPDALAGAPLAASVGGPLLLTPSGSLDAFAAAEIDRLGPSEVIVLGGNAAISDNVVNALRSRPSVTTVTRIGGRDRFETSALIANELGDFTEAYVVEGSNADPLRGWPDALSVAPLAAFRGVPILLVTRDAVPSPTASALNGLTSATIIGGTNAVSSSVQSQVDALVGSVSRIAGSNRYDTSYQVALASQRAGMDADATWFATGGNFPDALAAGGAVAHEGGILLLVPGTDFDASSRPGDWLTGRLDSMEVITLVGGTAAISSATESDIRNAANR